MNSLKTPLQKNIIVSALISILPFTIYFLFFASSINSDYRITDITSYFFAFKIFYLFCFSLTFNLDNKKNQISEIGTITTSSFKSSFLGYKQTSAPIPLSSGGMT